MVENEDEKSSEEFDIEHCLINQGQGHEAALKFFLINHNTNCQVLYLSVCTC